MPEELLDKILAAVDEIGFLDELDKTIVALTIVKADCEYHLKRLEAWEVKCHE